MDDDFDDEVNSESQPLPQHEAALVRRDIDDLVASRQTFEPEGLKGVSIFCADCVEEHYYGWDMLESNLRALLESGDYPVHEPPYDPRPEDYIDWQYAQGYVDGARDASPPPRTALQADHCPFCGEELGQFTAAAFCPSCGTPLGIALLAAMLVERGWEADAVEELLEDAGLPLPALPGEDGA